MIDLKAIREDMKAIQEVMREGIASTKMLRHLMDHSLNLLAEVERQAKEIERLAALKASELPLTFPCGCGFGMVSGLEYIDSGTVLKCEGCGMEQVVVMKSFAEKPAKEEDDGVDATTD